MKPVRQGVFVWDDQCNITAIAIVLNLSGVHYALLSDEVSSNDFLYCHL